MPCFDYNGACGTHFDFDSDDDVVCDLLIRITSVPNKDITLSMNMMPMVNDMNLTSLAPSKLQQHE